MHPCLEIDEIVTAICIFLLEKDLLSLALTCKHFQEPALSVLWRHVGDIELFMKLFPKDAWYGPGELFQRGSIWQSENPMILKRLLTPEDWKATAPYTSYVRSLALKCDNIQSTMLISAAQSFAGNHVFPGLQKLLVLDQTDSYLPFIKLTLSPSLTHLLLNLDVTPTVLLFLSQLGTSCPSIESFRFSWIGRRRPQDSVIQESLLALVGSISQAVVSWNRLKSICVAGLTPYAMEHISHLSTLREFAFQREVTLRLHQDHTVIYSGFESLCRFQLFEWPLESMTQFMEAWRTTRLGKFHVLLPIHPKAEQWPQFFRVVANCSTAAESLEVCVKSSDGVLPPPIDDPYLVGNDALRPVLGHNLVALDLSNMYHFSLTDDFIEGLARASPQLVIVNIGTERATGRSPTLTLAAYGHILTNCPCITTLGLVVDTSNARGDEPKPRGDYFRWPGRGDNFCFFVGDSVATNPAAVASFLAPFFDQPVSQWCLAENTTYDSFHGWNEVFNHLLPAFIDGKRPSTPYVGFDAPMILQFEMAYTD